MTKKETDRTQNEAITKYHQGVIRGLTLAKKIYNTNTSEILANEAIDFNINHIKEMFIGR